MKFSDYEKLGEKKKGIINKKILILIQIGINFRYTFMSFEAYLEDRRANIYR